MIFVTHGFKTDGRGIFQSNAIKISPKMNESLHKSIGKRFTLFNEMLNFPDIAQDTVKRLKSLKIAENLSLVECFQKTNFLLLNIQNSRKLPKSGFR